MSRITSKKAIAEYSAIAKSYGLFTANTVYKTTVQGNQAHREKDSNSQDDSDGKNGGKWRDYQADGREKKSAYLIDEKALTKSAEALIASIRSITLVQRGNEKRESAKGEKRPKNYSRENKAKRIENAKHDTR